MSIAEPCLHTPRPIEQDVGRKAGSSRATLHPTARLQSYNTLPAREMECGSHQLRGLREFPGLYLWFLLITLRSLNFLRNRERDIFVCFITVDDKNDGNVFLTLYFSDRSEILMIVISLNLLHHSIGKNLRLCRALSSVKMWWWYVDRKCELEPHTFPWMAE